MNHYIVISGLIGEYEYSSDGQTMGYEEYPVFVPVEAENKKDAISFALRTEEFKPWLKYCRDDRVSPYKGLQVTNPVCRHGKCWCHEECDECLNETIETL